MCHRPLNHNLSQWDVWVYLPSDSFHIFCGLSLCLSNYLPIISFWKLICYMLIFHYIIVGWMTKHSLWHPENYRFNAFFFRCEILSTLYTIGNCLLRIYWAAPLKWLHCLLLKLTNILNIYFSSKDFVSFPHSKVKRQKCNLHHTSVSVIYFS